LPPPGLCEAAEGCFSSLLNYVHYVTFVVQSERSNLLVEVMLLCQKV